MISFNGLKLTSDSISELHDFAKKMEISRSWYTPPNKQEEGFYTIIDPHKAERIFKSKLYKRLSKLRHKDLTKV